MRLNMYMIAEYLPCEKMSVFFSERAKEPCLLQPRLYNECTMLLDRYLYVLKGEDFPENFPEDMPLYMILLGRPADPKVLEEHEVILIEDHISLLSLFDILQQSFEWYNLWEESLQRIVDDDADLMKMCEVSRKIFRNPIIIHDAAYEVMVTTETPEIMAYLDFDYNQTSGAYFLSSRMMNIFKRENAFLDTMGQKEVANYHSDHMSYDVLYANLNGDGEFMGRVILPGIVSENSYSVYPPLRVLRDAVFAAIRRQNAFSKGLRRSFHRFFRDILGGSAVDRGYGDYCLHSRSWKPEDAYRCLVISLREIEIRTFSVSYNCQRLEEIFPDSFAFFYENNIISIIHFNGEPQDSAFIAEKIDDFLRESYFKAGLSIVYRDVYKTDVFFRQALAALDFGGGFDPESRCYPFRKYALPYVFRYGMGDTPPEFFCDEALLKLKTLGGGEGVDYYTTLKVYLENNMNLLHSAEKLYIHRTTLFYRINRIKEKLDIDLNDEDTRRSLLMSFYMMDIAARASQNA